jgi:hypothetical protein
MFAMFLSVSVEESGINTRDNNVGQGQFARKKKAAIESPPFSPIFHQPVG